MHKQASLWELFDFLKDGFSSPLSGETNVSWAAKAMRRQAQAAYGSVVITVGSNILILALLLSALWGSVPEDQLIAWSMSVCATLVALVWAKLRFIQETSTVAARTGHWAIVLGIVSLLRALGWSVGTVAFFPGADQGQQLVMGLTAAAMMCGGAFALAPLPITAVLFTVLTGGGSALALVLTGTEETLALAMLTVVFIVFLVVMIVNQTCSFVTYAKTDLTAREQRETIRMLLKEFEQNSSDWLWHTNEDGRFINVGERFSAASGLSVPDLEALGFAEMFSSDSAYSNDVVIDLHSLREPLSAVTVTVFVEGERRFWSLTAGPVFDDFGKYVGYRGVASDVTEKRAAARRLENLAHFDQLTGLLNRSSFLDALAAVIGESGVGSVGIVLFDLTGFKLVNDTLGHGVGDELLARLGERLTGLGAPDRTFSRLGGDEFVLMINSYPTHDEIVASAREVLSLFEIPFSIGPHNVVVDASAGVALGGAHGADAVALMRSADLALYAAKSRGRGLWQVFDAEMAAAYMRRQNLERALRGAIEGKELSLQFQPIVSAKAGAVSAFEALLRWDSTEFGSVNPEEFIPIAEECGLIVPIGNWALREAAKVSVARGDGLQVCVNVSPVQLRNMKLVGAVRECLFESGLAPERLVLEITEGIFLEANAQTDGTLRELLAMGVQIALDDFGKGYSSLSYMRSFPFSKIKIDKSFIEDIAGDGPNAQIVRAIVALADALRFEVVAEGVETHAQLAEIVELGCGYAQGFLFSKPLSEADLPAFLARMGPGERAAG